ncbi:hypothetical protein PR048_014670 [Dryococelus australis]|uniref:Uncharacterized protein n=1 Tax=Dryococelus australis TaxID=614101 RepID=A0ABQ9HEU9_9NEOP|nr:hypothetical protein PR048_014670 [Dryococelus australis]
MSTMNNPHVPWKVSGSTGRSVGPIMRFSLVTDHWVGLVLEAVDSVCWRRFGEILTLDDRPGGERQPAPVVPWRGTRVKKKVKVEDAGRCEPRDHTLQAVRLIADKRSCCDRRTVVLPEKDLTDAIKQNKTQKDIPARRWRHSCSREATSHVSSGGAKKDLGARRRRYEDQGGGSGREARGKSNCGALPRTVEQEALTLLYVARGPRSYSEGFPGNRSIYAVLTGIALAGARQRRTWRPRGDVMDGWHFVCVFQNSKGAGLGDRRNDRGDLGALITSLTVVQSFSRRFGPSDIFPFPIRETQFSFPYCKPIVLLSSINFHKRERLVVDLTRKQQHATYLTAFLRQDKQSVKLLTSVKQLTIRHWWNWTKSDKIVPPLPLRTTCCDVIQAGGWVITAKYSIFVPAHLPPMRMGFTPPPPGRVAPGFPHVRIVPDDAVDRWVFSGISRFPRPFIPTLLHNHLNRPHRLSRSRSKYLPITHPNYRNRRLESRCGRTISGWSSAGMKGRGDGRSPYRHITERIRIKVTEYLKNAEVKQVTFSVNSHRLVTYLQAPQPKWNLSQYAVANQTPSEFQSLSWTESKKFIRQYPRLLNPLQTRRGRGGAVVRLLAFHLGEPDSIPGRVAPELSPVGIVLDDIAGRRVFSGISCSLRPSVPALPRARIVSPSSALKTSTLRASQISPSNISGGVRRRQIIAQLRNSKYSSWQPIASQRIAEGNHKPDDGLMAPLLAAGSAHAL